MKKTGKPHHRSKGFALIITISLTVLLAALSVGALGLATITLRDSSQVVAMAEAKANARMALKLALGELQLEMGPDMRISVESAIFDSDVLTPEIEGLAQSRWMGTYDSWGEWLNASYTPPGAGAAITIGDTYEPRRERMFRRWLVTLPQGMERDVLAPDELTGWDDANSVVLLGAGSLGDAAAARPDQVTRARLVPTVGGGMHAWWIGPENHKAGVDVGGAPRDLAVDQWEASHGNTAEVAAGLLPGMASLEDNPGKRARLASIGTLRAAGVPEDVVQAGFFDLTATSRGVLANVRTGRLKKDLSLLFELPNDQLPERYRWQPGLIQEPSIRPMSPDLLAHGPRIPNRHFASWTNMRHFYRMYRSGSDASIGGTAAGNPSAGALQWADGKPWTTFVVTGNVGTHPDSGPWNGSNSYWRYPALAKITFIYSLRTTKVDENAPDHDPNTQYRCSVVYTPVFVFWNPYNVELRIPDNQFFMMNNAYRVLPFRGEVYVNNQRTSTVINGASMYFSNLRSALRSNDGGDIVFKPGELRVFSHRTFVSGFVNALYPGFDPQAIGGEERLVATYTRSQNPSVALMFSESVQHGNHQWGNTPGSLSHTPDWNGGRIPLMYQNDWFQVAQTRTPITPDPEPGAGGTAARPAELAPWDFSTSVPLPVGYAQLSIKGLSPIDYESIDWDQDWRSRNWLHNPPVYGGNSLYISENTVVAHTQRVDNPYQMHFGPVSMAEMPRIISHVGSSAFLGSGSNPYERVNSASVQELPSAPISSLGGFSGMRINPGWADYARLYNPPLRHQHQGAVGLNTGNSSFFAAEVKATAYQSGVIGAGLGNSFIHPMIPRTGVYRYFNNSVSADPQNRQQPYDNINYNDNKVFNDFWDHALLLNDALWDDYFVSSLADQTRPGAGSAASLDQNIDRLIDGGQIANSRFRFHANGKEDAAARAGLQAADGYLKAAGHLMVEGMFNVNSTSVAAWYALFAGIRERQAVYRDQDGVLRPIELPEGKRIALTRFNTEVSDQEMQDPAFGVNIGGGMQGWTGVRFLDDDQLLRLAEECVRQVKLRGPFLNYSEFINRRMSDDELGLMGALQSAIDYDDASQDPDSINFRFKNGPDFMMDSGYLGSHEFATPEAMHGSRFAGIPGYVIQSDLLKPIANTLNVRDDTFRVRAYGESRDADGNVMARAWCEVIVQRLPAYVDPANEAHEPLRIMNADGTFADNDDITYINRRFGRRLEIVSFRWLHPSEI